MTASPKVRGEPAKEVAAARARPGRHLIAMTREPNLAQSLQALAATGLTIHIVEDLRSLADELLQHPTAVALLDAQSLGVPADAAVDAVNTQFPDVRLLVAGHATEQGLLASRISQQKVFRFVHKPASPQRLQLLIDAAHMQSPELRSAGAAAAAAADGTARPPRGGLPALPLAAAVVVLATLALGAWLLLRDEAPAAAMMTAPPSTVAAAPTPPPALQAVLQRAAAALADGRLVAADGSSAAELYREALRLDAGSVAAAEGFERAIEQSLSGAEQALLAGRLDDARVTAELLRLIVPDNSRLEFLYTQIGRELERATASTTQRQALESRQAQIREALQAMELRIAAGALVEPATDSALSRFREAEVIGGGDPLVRAGRETLVGALLTAADRALDNGRTGTARTLVDAAGSVNSSAPGIDIVRRRLEATTAAPVGTAGTAASAAATAGNTGAPTSTPAALSASVASPPPEPVTVTRTAPASATVREETAPAATSPATAPAPATRVDGNASAGQDVVSASSLRVRRRVDPEYPQLALQRLVSGWVDLEFTVTPDGTVRDVEVIAAEPQRTFDAAAVAAMRRYLFAPVVRDGEAIEQRARLRMRFTAEDGR